MLDVTVKTLDGQNRSFSVPDEMTVKQFKERIASSINVTAETQRLIFQGRVLQDEKLLKDYDVQGKVVHVVMRAPPSAGRPSNVDAPTPTSTTTNPRDPNSMVVGSFTLPAEVLDANMVQNIAQDAIRSMGNLGRNARVSTRTSPDGSSVDVHIHLGPVQTGQATSEAQNRLNTARQMMRLANDALTQFENPDAAARDSEASPAPTSTASTQADQAEDTADSPSSPMDTSETTNDQTSPSTSAEPRTERPESTANGSSSSSRGTTPDSQSEQGAEPNAAPRGPVRPNISALGEVLGEVQELSQRLQPHLQRFQEIVQEDGDWNQTEQRDNQRVCNLVSEVMHSVSHCYHAVSDLMVDLSQQRPRQLYVTLAIAHPHTTVMQQTIPIAIPVYGGTNATATTGTSAPRPPTAETGTQPNASSTTTSTGTGTGVAQPATAETGTQPPPAAPLGGATGTRVVPPHPPQPVGSGLTEEEMRRVTEEMLAGSGLNIGQGLHQGDGSPDNPFVFVEMRPDSVTVNSISAEVVTTTEPASNTASNNDASSTTTDSAAPGSGRPQPQPAPQPQPQPQPTGPGVGQGQLPLPPNFIQGLVQQILQQTTAAGGGAPPPRMQIHIGQRPPGAIPVRPPAGLAGMGPGGGMQFRPFVVRTSTPVSESGTQTATGSGPRPASSATQTSTPTSTFGTQTSTNTTAPSSTSGTQTPGRGAGGATAFVMPGVSGAAHSLNNPVDPYLQCSSRHFLTQHARSIINQAQPANDTALADMVGNLMSGFLGAAHGPHRGPRPNAPTRPTGGSGAPGAGGPRPATSAAPGAGAQQLPPGHIHIGGLPGFFPGRMPFIPGVGMRMTMPGTFTGTVPPPQPSSTATPGSTGTAAGNQSTPSAGPRPAAAAGAGLAPGSAAQAGAGGAGTSAGGEPQFVQMLRSMLQSASGAPPQPGSAPAPPTAATTTPPTTTTDQNQNIAPPGGAGTQPISDEAFTQLVSGITGFMTQAAMGQAPRQTIADFLGTLGQDYNLPMGEGFINEGLSCVLAHLQITDLIQVFYGQAGSLNQVQGPLRGFVLTRVLQGAPPFLENIRTSVERLVEQMEPEIQETVNSVTPRPHIDFHGTLVRFFHQQFNNVVSLIINARDGDPNFGQDLYACIRRLLSELFILCSRCLGGMPAVQQLVSQRLQTLTTGINPLVQEWMNSMTARQLNTFIPTIAITESEVSFYVTYKNQAQQRGTGTATETGTCSSSTSKSSSSAKGVGADSGTGSSGGAKSSTSATGSSTTVKAPAKPSTVHPPTEGADRKVSEKVEKSRPQPPARVAKPKETEKVTSSGQPMDTSPLSSASEASVESQELPRPVRGSQAAAAPRSGVTAQSPTVNGGDWTAVVPSEWVPVIAEDVERQQSQPPQAPFSDVYLQGVPPKRRKMMSDDKPNNISNISEAFPDSVRRAVGAAAVEPISSVENLTSEAVNDADLHQSYDSEIHSTIACRVNTDSDYRSDRFPNSEELYHKTDGEKK